MWRETGEKISAADESSATLVVKLDFDDPACPARAPSVPGTVAEYDKTR